MQHILRELKVITDSIIIQTKYRKYKNDWLFVTGYLLQ